MYTLRGFVNINGFVDNTPGVIAPIGELSSIARSFSREIGHYRDNQYPAGKLMSFESERDNVDVPVDVVYSTVVLKMTDWLFNESIKGDIKDQPEIVKQALQAEFKSEVKIIEIGEMATNGRYWFPSSIIFSSLESDDGTGKLEENWIRVWFTDAAFKAQYDKYDIIVACPFNEWDDFFLPIDTVITKIKAITAESHNRHIWPYRGENPETQLSTDNYDYVNPGNRKEMYPVPFSLFIYGLAGINSDIKREEIINEILKNSTHSRDEWEEILPDLFTPTEFYLIPIWDRLSLPDLGDKAAWYSSTISPTRQVNTAKKYAYGDAYNPEYLEKNIELFGTIYKSLAVVAVGHPKNRHAPTLFSELWPHYAIISSTALDFNRIDPDTQEFILVLQGLFKTAETMTPYSAIPEGMTRVKRGDTYYLTTQRNKVQYVMPLRLNFASVA